jgi:addiction module HigA family antidote
MSGIVRKMKAIHPGSLFKAEVIEEKGLTTTKAARMLKVSRQALSNLINEKAAVSPEMALRISTVFGGTPDIWLRLQIKFDLQKAEVKLKKIKLRPFLPTLNQG